ncbi:class I tRNA ligase family protein [Bacillus licheniformis]|nr:class I tRNA ligase family protein [Bacillus licheniformis]
MERRINKRRKIVIWTTTPWTIPANLGIAVHPELEYSVVAAGGARYVMASALIESVAKRSALKIMKSFRLLKVKIWNISSQFILYTAEIRL